MAMPNPIRIVREAWRRWWKRLLLVVGSTVLALGMVELGLRTFPRAVRLPPLTGYPGEHLTRDSRNFVVDDKTGWRMRPGHAFHWEIAGGMDLYQADAAGFRTGSQPPDPNRTFRIALAGDSFAFGTGVAHEESFGALLETRFPAVRLTNLAMPGFGMDQIWMSVRHQALGADPSPHLVVFAFIDDDFSRSLTAFRRKEGMNKPTFVIDDGVLRRQGISDRPGSWGRRLERLRVVRLAGRVSPALGRRWAVGTWWRRNAAIMTAAEADCASADVPVLFVRLPTQGTPPFPVLTRFFEERRTPFLDLGSEFPDGIHFASDAHIDERGHMWVAERIGDWIAERFGDRVLDTSRSGRSGEKGK